MSKLEYSKEDIIEMQDSITWWTNRFKAVERDNRKLHERIDKAIEYIKEYGNLYCLKHTQFKKYKQYEELLEILGGEE